MPARLERIGLAEVMEVRSAKALRMVVVNCMMIWSEGEDWDYRQKDGVFLEEFTKKVDGGCQ